MGMIYGQYDSKEGAKGGQGFVPGGSSLHSCMWVAAALE
jgi:homogentisate 1,2-dioxygenase